MSTFDPHGLYFRSNRKTHKGQIIQKRFVDHDSSFSKEDLTRSFRVLSAYGYYTSQTPFIDPIAKSISFNIFRYFFSDQTLKFNEVFNSILRSHLLSLNPNFLDTDPSEVKHFFLQISVSSIQGTMSGGTSLGISTYNGLNESVNFTSSASSAICIYPVSDSQIVVLHAPSAAGSQQVNILGLDLGNVAIETISFDDVDYYHMLYYNDFSQLSDDALVTLSLSQVSVNAIVNISMTYVNFD